MTANEEEAIESCKVVLIGEAGVGKTSIIAQFIYEDFTPNRPSTIGAVFSSKSMQIDDYEREVKFEIWDTAGQEKYKALTPMFSKDASIAVFVYDITREESFNALKDYWIEQIKSNGPENMLIAIAANKSDLYESEKVDQKNGIELAKSLDAIFKSTSAKNHNGITSLFTDLGRKYLSLNLKKVDRKTVALVPEKNDKDKDKDKDAETTTKRKCC